MQVCPQCDARLGPGVERCEFCGLVTEAGREAEARAAAGTAEAQRLEAHAQAKRQAQLTLELGRKATHALLWSVGGFLIWCAFLPSLVGWFQGRSTSNRARAAGIPVPGSARIAQWIGALGAVLGVASWSYMVMDIRRSDAEVQRRLEKVTQELGDAAKRPVIDQPAACRMAEQYLLTHGYDGQSANNLNSFSCPGKLISGGDQAALQDYTFSLATDEPTIRVWVCFAHGTGWYVQSAQVTACPHSSPSGGTPPANAR